MDHQKSIISDIGVEAGVLVGSAIAIPTMAIPCKPVQEIGVVTASVAALAIATPFVAVDCLFSALFD